MKKSIRKILVKISRYIVALSKSGAEYNNSRNHLGLLEYITKFTNLTKDNDCVANLSFVSKDAKLGVFLERKSNSNGHLDFYSLFPQNKVYFIDEPEFLSADIYIVIGLGYTYRDFIYKILLMGKSCYIFEENYLRSVLPVSMKSHEIKNPDYFKPISYFIESKAPHFCSGIQSSVELSLNKITEFSLEQIARSRTVMDRIVTSEISKYNCQKRTTEKIPSEGPNILLIDQAYNDYSVLASGGSVSDFEYMLYRAIEDNPNSNVIIKTHVDRVSRETYFSRIRIPDNVIILDEAVNPIRLLKSVDKIYTYSSTMGFEALMCGKEVYTFGLPIYGGWGLTNDFRSYTHLRQRERSLEDLFYSIYIEYSLYFNPYDSKLIEIEEALDKLLIMIEEYNLGTGDHE